MKKINIIGAIVSNNSKEVYKAFGLDSTSPKDVVDNLPQNNEAIEVIINSPGGDVFAGFDMYTALKEYNGNITVKIVGLAASAASVPAMAGDKILISPVGQFMIHNVSTYVEGNQHELKQVAEQVEELSRGLCNAYVLRTGKSEKEIQQLMDEETYFSAKKAVEFGLADEIMYTTAAAHKELLVASASTNGILPQVVLDDYFLNKEKEKKPVRRDFLGIPLKEKQQNEKVKNRHRGFFM